MMVDGRSTRLCYHRIDLLFAEMIKTHNPSTTSRYDPGPRSTAYKQTWLYTAYPSLATVPLILANALVTLHR